MSGRRFFRFDGKIFAELNGNTEISIKFASVMEMKGCFLRMLIQPVVFVAVSCLMCVISIDAAEQKYGSRFYEELAGMDSREIYRHALRVSKNEHTDSAIAYYTVVVNRYSDNLNDSDKMMMAQAMCNLGAMTYYHVQDYNRSYRYLLKGLEVACEVKHERLKPYIYVNLSDIHSLFGDSVMSDRLCRKAFWMGKELKDDYIYKNALLELICKQILYGNFGSIEKDLADFGRHGLPEGTPLRDYTYYVYDGVMAYINGDYDKCLSYLDKASMTTKDMHLEELYRIVSDMLAAKAFAVTGRYGEAIERLKPYTKDGIYKNVRNYTFCALSDLYAKSGKADSARIYKVERLLMNDSSLNYKEYMVLRDTELKYLPADIKDSGSMQSESGGQGGGWRIAAVAATVAIALGIVCVMIYWRRIRRRRRGNAGVAEVVADEAGAESQESSRVQPAGIDDKTVQLAGAIKHYMETSGDIYDPDFSLDKLAADVGAHTRNVSRAVNEVFGINFSTMLSNYRVNEACRRLSSPDYANVTIQAIAADVGFKSRSNFIAVFRRQTGMPPNEYKKKSESKSNPD